MTNKNKINSILDMMDDLQENLLALPDDMLLGENWCRLEIGVRH